MMLFVNNPNIDLLTQIELHHLANILTTSGTTGNPKGIAQEHKTLANLVQWQAHFSPLPLLRDACAPQDEREESRN